MAACIFDEPAYANARESRLRCLFASLPRECWSGKRVLELGCGTGEIGQALSDAGAEVVSVDAVASYIDELRRRFPGREAHVRDVDTWDGSGLGAFDGVLCFGLIYHLRNPRNALRICAKAQWAAALESVVCDRDEPVCPEVEEAGPDQAYSGRGCRPSVTWITATSVEFGMTAQDVSSHSANWKGTPGSVFDWKTRNDWAWMRDGSLLRRMFLLRPGTATR